MTPLVDPCEIVIGKLHRGRTAHLLHLPGLGLLEARPLRGSGQVFAHAWRADVINHKRTMLTSDTTLFRLTVKANRMNEPSATLINRLTRADQRRFSLIQIVQQ